MRTIEKTIYTYSELSEEAQEKARDIYRDSDDMDYLYDDMQYRLEELFEEYGIKDVNTRLRYSLSYSQGDGASFVGDIEWKAWRATIDTNQWGNHYQHSKTVQVNEMSSLKTDKDAPEATYGKLQAIVEEIGDKLAEYGYDVIETARMDENVEDAILSSEYEYNEDGTRYF